MIKKEFCSIYFLFSVIFLLLAVLVQHASARSHKISVNGHGNLVFDGALRTFSFHAQKRRSGESIGNLLLINRSIGVRNNAEIDCLRVNGDEAFLSGFITQDSLDESFVGATIWFHIKNNGEGRGDPADQMTLLYLYFDPIIDCETPLDDVMKEIEAQGDDPPVLMEIMGGNIQVK